MIVLHVILLLFLICDIYKFIKKTTIRYGTILQDITMLANSTDSSNGRKILKVTHEITVTVF